MAQNKAVAAIRANPGKTAAAGAVAAAMALATPLIVKWEGLRNDPYNDIVGVKTVCVGETNVAMRRYTDAECTAMLQKSLTGVYATQVIRCTPVLVDRPYNLAAATSLAYNIGTAAYCRSTVAKRFNAGDFVGACNGFLSWSYAGGKQIPGLLNRRRDERRLCLQEAGQ